MSESINVRCWEVIKEINLPSDKKHYIKTKDVMQSKTILKNSKIECKVGDTISCIDNYPTEARRMCFHHRDGITTIVLPNNDFFSINPLYFKEIIPKK